LRGKAAKGRFEFIAVEKERGNLPHFAKVTVSNVTTLNPLERRAMNVTEAEVRLAQVDSSRFPETDTFKPLPHGVVIDAVESALNAAGLEIARDDNGALRRRFTLVDRGAKMYGTLPLTNRIDGDSRLMVGFANSWNKTLALRLGFGAEVFVCTNGSIFCEKVIGRKHTTNILNDLPGLVLAALEQTKSFIAEQAKFFERLRSVNLTDKDADHFIVRSALDHDCITVGEIADVASEWRKPRFEEFAPRTAWSLHNAYTEVGKRIQSKNGNLHSERLVRLSGLFADSFANDLSLSATLTEIAASN